MEVREVRRKGNSDNKMIQIQFILHPTIIMEKLLFGTSGIPVSTKGQGTEEGIRQVKRLGLEAMELAFVHSIHIREDRIPAVKNVAKQENIMLTCHAPYYINLNATDQEKRKACAQRLLNAARVTAACGGWSVCFHAGYYMGMPHPQVYENIKEALEWVLDTLKSEGHQIWIRPEIGGKITSWGSLEEIIKLSEELEGVLPCIDWAHLYARSLGKNNSHASFSEALGKIESSLGKKALDNMHCHVEGIEIGKTGEKCHVNLEDSAFNYQDLLRAWADFNIKGIIISESPAIEQNALLLKSLYSNNLKEVSTNNTS